MQEFLKNMSVHYNIVIFTASISSYAEAVTNLLDKNRLYIQYILSREHCFLTKNGFFIKDLRIIRNGDLRDMIIIDNLLHSFVFQINNGIPILEWNNDEDDRELYYMQKHLIKLSQCEDVRSINKATLKLFELINLDLNESIS